MPTYFAPISVQQNSQFFLLCKGSHKRRYRSLAIMQGTVEWRRSTRWARRGVSLGGARARGTRRECAPGASLFE